MIVIGVTRPEQEIFPQLSSKKKPTTLNWWWYEQKKEFTIFDISSSIDEKFNRRGISTINLLESLFFLLVATDKIFTVHNLKVLSRDLRNLNAVKIYSVHRRYELLFFSIKVRHSNLNINTLEHHFQDLHLELIYIDQLFDHRKGRYEFVISLWHIRVFSTRIYQKCCNFMYSCFFNLIDVKKIKKFNLLFFFHLKAVDEDDRILV